MKLGLTMKCHNDTHQTTNSTVGKKQRTMKATRQTMTKTSVSNQLSLPHWKIACKARKVTKYCATKQ